MSSSIAAQGAPHAGQVGGPQRDAHMISVAPHGSGEVEHGAKDREPVARVFVVPEEVPRQQSLGIVGGDLDRVDHIAAVGIQSGARGRPGQASLRAPSRACGPTAV